MDAGFISTGLNGKVYGELPGTWNEDGTFAVDHVGLNTLVSELQNGNLLFGAEAVETVPGIYAGTIRELAVS